MNILLKYSRKKKREKNSGEKNKKQPKLNIFTLVSDRHSNTADVNNNCIYNAHGFKKKKVMVKGGEQWYYIRTKNKL